MSRSCVREDAPNWGGILDLSGTLDPQPFTINVLPFVCGRYKTTQK